MILQIGPELKPFAGTLLSFACSSGISMLSFVIAVALSGFLLVPGPALADKARAVVRHVDAKHGDEFMHLTSVTIRNLARGVIGVSLLQALLIGIGLIVAGIPGAGLLALCALISRHSADRHDDRGGAGPDLRVADDEPCGGAGAHALSGAGRLSRHRSCGRS